MITFSTIHAEITWSLSDDGILTISGTDMPSYSSGDAPWYSQKDEIKKVVIKDGVKNIGYLAFNGCSSLTTVTIPNSVISIGESAFKECLSLTAVTIPNSVTSIGSGAFATCIGLTSVTIPSSVTSIGSGAFIGCTGLTSITIPNSVTSIGDEVFYGCTGLTFVTIPNSVMSIGESAFRECSSLTTVTIPNSVISIGTYAFVGCSGLTSVTIPNSVTSIGRSAFHFCKALTSITIPNSVTSIEENAFRGCTGLTSITCEANTPPSLGNTCFNVDRSIPVYVPANSIEAYKTADKWNYFTNIQAFLTISLSDGEPYTNNSQFNGRDISYTRTFNNTKWQALYIPFSLNYNDWKNDFEVAYINGIRQYDKNDDGAIDETIMDVIKIKEGSLIPNTPYLIKAKSVGEKTFSLTDATLYPAEENSIDCRTTIAEYTFTGTYSTIPSATLIANQYYAMGGGELIISDGSNDLKPYRWYMKIDARSPMYNTSNPAKAITINVVGEESETTGICQLQMSNDKLPVYDLNGRRVSENSLKPGVYIKNGKKVIIE